MGKMGELYQTADWKSEKHVPVIECPDNVAADQVFDVKVTLGKEVAHPNTTEHHIRWIRLFFKPDSDKFPTRWVLMNFRRMVKPWPVPIKVQFMPIILQWPV